MVIIGSFLLVRFMLEYDKSGWQNSYCRRRPLCANGTERGPESVIMPPNAGNILTIFVTAVDLLGCSCEATRDFRVITQTEAARESRICDLPDSLRTIATIVFHPNPLRDPLKDLITRPPSRADIERQKGSGRESHLLNFSRLIFPGNSE